MKLTEAEKSQVRAIIQSPQWRAVERVANLFRENIESDSVVRDSQWDTLKTALINEGKSRGIKGFIDELYKTTT